MNVHDTEFGIANGYKFEIGVKVASKKCETAPKFCQKPFTSDLLLSEPGPEVDDLCCEKAETHFLSFTQLPGVVRMPPGTYTSFELNTKTSLVTVLASNGRRIATNYHVETGETLLIDEDGRMRILEKNCPNQVLPTSDDRAPDDHLDSVSKAFSIFKYADFCLGI